MSTWSIVSGDTIPTARGSVKASLMKKDGVTQSKDLMITARTLSSSASVSLSVKTPSNPDMHCLAVIDHNFKPISVLLDNTQAEAIMLTLQNYFEAKAQHAFYAKLAASRRQ